MLVETDGHYKSQMARVRAATLGEVVMFAGPNQPIDHLQPEDTTFFRAVMGVYRGTSDSHGILIGPDSKRIYAGLVHGTHEDGTSAFPVEMAIVDVHGNRAPMFLETRGHLLALAQGSQVIIGPEEIFHFVKGDPQKLLYNIVSEYLGNHGFNQVPEE
ncbi:MAG: hypothetical protein V1735_06215 [Nanoarchaeota archaeon]